MVSLRHIHSMNFPYKLSNRWETKKYEYNGTLFMNDLRSLPQGQILCFHLLRSQQKDFPEVNCVNLKNGSTIFLGQSIDVLLKVQML